MSILDSLFSFVAEVTTWSAVDDHMGFGMIGMHSGNMSFAYSEYQVN
jgi:hypothetical protein